MRWRSLTRIVLLTGVLLVVLWIASHRSANREAPPLPKGVQEVVAQVAKIEASEAKASSEIWGKELLAEQCGHTVENLWDAMNAASNRLSVLSCLEAAILAPEFGVPEHLPHDIEASDPIGPGATWSPTEWKAFLHTLQSKGWELVQTEFRHTQFDVDAQGQPKESRYWASGNLVNHSQSLRASLEGELRIRWQRSPDASTNSLIQTVDASRLRLKTRYGEPPFREVLNETVTPPEGSYFIDPLIVHDLDGDGVPEIILASKNLVWRRDSQGRYHSEPLLRYPPGLIFSAVLADFDGDGIPDLLCAKFEGLYLFKGSASGSFDEPGRLVWAANPHLKYAQVLTCGDIDADGDLDVWLGQYKVPYERGQMPTPYFDANDGYPSYLLINDGSGNFSDGTEAAGLGKKRWRRAYSGSFVDVDGNGSLDLLVAADFAGLDLYLNDGHGHFSDATSRFLGERHGFGMSQLCADFNRDGQLDLLMVGMSVPVAARWQHFATWRPGFEDYFKFASAMSYGNRLFLAQPGGAFVQTSLSESVVRTGWSWGATAADLDNDGFPDLYIANGHESKQSVRDYETEFWLHDIYVGNSRDNLAAAAYFQAKAARTRGRGRSYGGYEKNRLFFNAQGERFWEAGHLMGVALEQDCRNVMGADLDGDGRPDLLVTTFEAWPEFKQTLRVYQNRLSDTGNWIGFRFREGKGSFSPVGARVTIHTGGATAVQQIVTGDSYRSQGPATVQFGLGKAQRVDSVQVRWPTGKSIELESPAANEYHWIPSPGP